MHYNINRYYDPATGRYTQSDPIGLAGGINTYTYVGGNSIRWSDPKGLQLIPGAVVGALAGSISYGMTCSIANNCTGLGFIAATGVGAITGFVGGPMCAIRAISTVNVSVVGGMIMGAGTALKKW